MGATEFIAYEGILPQPYYHWTSPAEMLPGFAIPIFPTRPDRPYEIVGWVCVHGDPAWQRMGENARQRAVTSLAITAKAHGADAMILNHAAPSNGRNCYVSCTAVRWVKR